ncbi:MAG: MiaB/RimO family radical SAM methylthiotransferase [Candidatus Moraniibacteriota bacterium]
MIKKYFIHTFGCQQNMADSERVASFYESRGFLLAPALGEADVIILNTCVIRERAEEKVFGLIRSVREGNYGRTDAHIVITGCLIGAATREPSGKMLKKLRLRLPDVEFLPMEEVGFEHVPKRIAKKSASIPISNGCNNYCAFCIVPFSRGKEVSRPFEDILEEARGLADAGYEEVLLLGQNVNSYGSDFLMEKLKDGEEYEFPDGKKVRPTMVKHLNRHRIPTLFPELLDRVARIPGLKKVSFIASNPWDFSDELIDVIARNMNIDRLLHLPVQSGSSKVLQLMNRWYTREEYLALIDRIRMRIPDMRFTTDIIVAFPGETIDDFEDSKNLVREVGFEKVYIAWFSPRPGTVAKEKMEDGIPIEEKKRRFKELDDLVLDLSDRTHLKEKHHAKNRG